MRGQLYDRYNDVDDNKVLASKISPDKQSRITHNTSCPISGCIPSIANITRPWLATIAFNQLLSFSHKEFSRHICQLGA
jgi:hypothetical protein